MTDIKVGIIAGTPIDTQMGVAFINQKGIHARAYPVSESPQEQSKLQVLSPDELADIIKLIVRRAKSDGMTIILVYCNSLSAAVDMNTLSHIENIPIVSPLDAYKSIVGGYSRLGVLAANNQSCAGIERTIQGTNPDCEVIGLGILPLVMAIETQKHPSEIFKEFSLDLIIDFYQSVEVEAIVLGCTHFSYIKNQFELQSKVEVIDPSEVMYSLIIELSSIRSYV